MAKTLVIAHRGASSLAPENTISAFRKAVELGADGIELDVQLSKDGHLVVIHDEQVNRTTNGTGLVKDYTLAQLAELDAGGWFSKEYSDQGIVTLNQVFQEFKGLDLMYNIEIKSGVILYPGIERALMEQIESMGLEERVVISSFNHYSLVQCKEYNPHIRVGILYMAGLYRPWNYAKTLDCYSIHPYFYGIKPEIIQGCKENGVSLFAWTVNDPQYMAGFVQAGVEAIITDKPQLLIALEEGVESHEV